MAAVVELEVGGGDVPGAWIVRVLRSAGTGGGRGVFEVDVDALLGRLRSLEETVLASSVVARRVLTPGESDIQRIGTELFDGLFRDDVEAAYRTSRAVALSRGETVQLRLRLTDPRLAALPWETLYDRTNHAYVCRKDSLIRQIPSPDSLLPPQRTLPLRILAMVSSPRRLDPIDAEGERARLEDALAAQTQAGLVQLEWLEDVTWESLHTSLLAGEWHVLHFIGHSRYDVETDQGELAFSASGGRTDWVGADSLADLIAEAEPAPRLVVLNSCLSGATGFTELYSGTASALVRNGVDAVVAMQFSITDDAALAFARGFYGALAHGRTIDDATRSGRIAILGMGRDTLEWVTPVLCLRGEDTRLFEARASAAERPQPAAPSEPVRAQAQRDAGEVPRTADADAVPDEPPAPAAKEDGRAEASAAEDDDLDRAPAHADAPDPPRTRVSRGRRWAVVAVLAIGVLAAAAFAVSMWLQQAGDDQSTETTPPAASTPPTPAIATTVVEVPGAQLWKQTGIECRTGAPLLIRASGTVQHGPTVDRTSGPDGMPGERLDTNVISDANHAALIARIGEFGTAFVVGSALDTVCDADGELFLGINDEGFVGNTGQYLASVRYEQ
ncbi:CHAT domain-containing protein [Microbacterium ulmi]|uniref:CHAT domain-containing protein n=1 Tax=Microbacterium ulmi TaxID=179095 RepID=A0A7Y2PZ59_9MICO|nr:CHAT domain-containing protein [Microbacterium ulmi]NII70938.1 hypothetical protein [Microbacterium ulmi]NNH02948.1 CHAT domain-containing protein [Microbacterium ulmi]